MNALGIFKKSKNPHAKQEAELADRQRRRDALAAKLEAAQRESESANAERRRLLIEVDAASAKDIASAETACRDAADRVSGLEDAVRSVAAQINDAEQALAAQREQGDRELAAAECERRAGAIDAAADRLADALRMVADGYMALRDAIHIGGVAASEHVAYVDYAAGTYATSTLACGLEGTIPDILSQLQRVGVVQGETADRTARRLQSDRLRRHADDLRSGRVPVALLPAPTEAAYRPPPRIEKTILVLAEPVVFRDEYGVQIRVIAGAVEIPVLVADKAVELGIGHPIESAEGQRILSTFKSKPNAAIGGWRDVGVNLRDWAEAERQRSEELQ